MIKALKQYLQNSFDDDVYEDKDRSLRLACTVMMYEVLRADAETHPEEIKKIRQHVAHAFELDEDETNLLMQQAQHETEHAISLHDVVRAVNDAYLPEDKRDLIRMLWEVAYADGELDKYEEHTIRKLADWLYVPHRDFIRMKHEVADI
jgi:uncharacterized tellurite resistance protein B-like protein